ncbi:short-chain dehydrogenase/reductase SDR [Morchella snyderi]|nr:short-chain dehydrogenase/reductase SDR [Morchella snyderi]
MIRLAGNALITGAGLGIGRATTLAYARAGASGIAIADVNTESLKAVAAEAKKIATNKNFEVVPVHTDVTNEVSVRNMVETTVKSLGRIDYACNIAGMPVEKNTPACDVTKEEWDFTNNVNVNGVLFCQREELKAMMKQELVSWEGRDGFRGSIVNMASVAGFFATPSTITYVAGKHAVLGITRAAALDHAADGIRVNSVCPGPVGTELLNRMSPTADFAGSTMQNRIARPEEIADVVVFLGSPMASFVTGASWKVDGGYSSF